MVIRGCTYRFTESEGKAYTQMCVCVRTHSHRGEIQSYSWLLPWLGTWGVCQTCWQSQWCLWDCVQLKNTSTPHSIFRKSQWPCSDTKFASSYETWEAVASSLETLPFLDFHGMSFLPVICIVLSINSCSSCSYQVASRCIFLPTSPFISIIEIIVIIIQGTQEKCKRHFLELKYSNSEVFNLKCRKDKLSYRKIYRWEKLLVSFQVLPVVLVLCFPLEDFRSVGTCTVLLHT